LFQEGSWLAKHGRAAEAISPLLGALKQSGPGPAPADILHRLAQAYAAVENKEEAFKTLLYAAETDPEQATEFWREARECVTPQLAPGLWSSLVSSWVSLWQESPASAKRTDSLLLASKVAVSAGENLPALDLIKQIAGEKLDAAHAGELAGLLDEVSDNLTRLDDFENSTAAVRLAIQLQPVEARRYWTLMDILYRKSFIKEAPFVNLEDIQQSVEAWNQSLPHGAPGTSDGWWWTARAVVNEQLVRLPDTDGWQLGLEAATYCERALILDDSDSWNWTNLARWHRYLNLDACEDFATWKLLNVQGDDVTTAALDERIICLSNAGKFDEMERIVKVRREHEDSSWLIGVQAFARLQHGENDVAVEMAGEYLRDDPNVTWCREVMADAYRRMGKATEADAVYEKLLDGYRRNDREDAKLAARSAFYLRQVDRAIEIAESYSDRFALPTDGFSRVELGLYYLAIGDIQKGVELVADGLPHCGNIRHLDELLRFDLPWHEQYLKTARHGAKAKAAMQKPREGIRAQLRSRIAELKHRPPTPEQELRDLLSTLGSDGAAGWLSVAVRAGLARLMTVKDPEGAAAAYCALLKAEPVRFADAQHALNRIAHKWVAEGDEFLGSDGPAAAASYAKALVMPIGDGPDVAADALAGRAFIAAAAGNSADAEAELQRLIETAPDVAMNVVGDRFGALVPNEQTLWRADTTLERISAASSASHGALREAAARGRSALLNQLNHWYAASPDAEDRWPIATPIALEIGSGLIPEDTGENWALFKSYIPEMRDRIQSRSGVFAPGVRVRSSSSPDPGAYSIAILDVARPLEAGTVPIGLRFCPVAPEQLQALGIPPETLDPARQPGKRSLGCWIGKQHWKRVEKAKLELWAESLVYVIRQLEVSILRHLHELLGVDEAWKIAVKWQEANETKDLVNTVLSSPADRLHFARLARVLVRDRVPLVRGDIILGALRTTPLHAISLPAAVRNIRLQLRDSLPGNGPNAQRLDLPEKWEKVVSRWAGGAREAADPHELHELVRSLREEFSNSMKDSRDGDVALVVRDAAAAPLVRHLLRHEIPDVAVLAREEVP
jgi:tetratricopeptide (TPR) repeat protein